MAWIEAPALAKAAGNSYSPCPTATGASRRLHFRIIVGTLVVEELRTSHGALLDAFLDEAPCLHELGAVILLPRQAKIQRTPRCSPIYLKPSMT